MEDIAEDMVVADMGALSKLTEFTILMADVHNEKVTVKASPSMPRLLAVFLPNKPPCIRTLNCLFRSFYTNLLPFKPFIEYNLHPKIVNPLINIHNNG